MSPKKLVKASGMTTVKSSASRSRRVSRRSFEASVQTRFTRASRVALPEAQDGDREERDREPQRDEQVEHDVGESAAAHDGVPALQQPAVGRELLDAGGTYAGIPKLTPNGWLLQGWDAVMRGSGLADIVLNLLVPLGFALAFFAVAVLRFRKRYA